MATRVTSVGTQSSVDTLSAAEYNDAAGGWIRSYSVTSTQGSINSGAGTGTDLSGLTTGSWTVPLRKFMFHFELAFSNDTADEQISVYLMEDGSILQRWDFHIGNVGSTNSTTSVSASFIYSPTAASHTYKLAAGRSGSGSGTFTLQASSTRLNQLTVYDCGPQ